MQDYWTLRDKVDRSVAIMAVRHRGEMPERHLGGDDNHIRAEAGDVAFAETKIPIRCRAISARINRAERNGMAKRTTFEFS